MRFAEAVQIAPAPDTVEFILGYQPIPDRQRAASLLIVSTRIDMGGVHVDVPVVPAELNIVPVYVLAVVYAFDNTVNVIDALTTDADAGGDAGNVAFTEDATELFPTTENILVEL